MVGMVITFRLRRPASAELQTILQDRVQVARCGLPLPRTPLLHRQSSSANLRDKVIISRPRMTPKCSHRMSCHGPSAFAKYVPLAEEPGRSTGMWVLATIVRFPTVESAGPVRKHTRAPEFEWVSPAIYR